MLKLRKKGAESLNLKFSQVLKLCRKGAESNADFKRCAEMCLNILFQRIQHLFINFQRKQHKPYIISAHSADFLQKYRLTSADPSTRVPDEPHCVTLPTL